MKTDFSIPSTSKMIKKIALFDLDWTLIYTGGAGIRALDHAFERLFKVSKGMKDVSADGKTDPAICREMILVHLKRDPKEGEVEALCQAYLDHLKLEIPTSEGYKILPGIPALLNALQQETSVLMGLGTGNLQEGARIKLARADFMRYFRFGGYGSDAEARPDVLRKGVERAHDIMGYTLEPRDVIVIGDNIRDVQAGKAIGATTIAVASGPMTKDELSPAEPDYLFQDLSDTTSVLNILLGK